MEGSPAVIDQLNRCLEVEWTAPEAYSLFASLFGVLGFRKLAEHWRKEAEEERAHGAALADRIIFLEGVPTTTHAEHPALPAPDRTPKPADLRGLYEAAHALETEVRDRYRDAIATARGNGGGNDEVTATLLARLLEETEAHIRHLEGDLAAMDLTGADNWLSAQV